MKRICMGALALGLLLAVAQADSGLKRDLDVSLTNVLIGLNQPNLDLGDLQPRKLADYVETTILQDFDISGIKLDPKTLNAVPSSWDGRSIAIVNPIKIVPGPIFSPLNLNFPNVTGAWSTPRNVCISVAQAPVDVYFLADNTGSMGSYIAAVKAAAAAIHSALSSSLTNLQIGVGWYKDWTVDNPGFKNVASINNLNAAAFAAAINQWSASGGGDWPEDQIWALHTLGSSGSIGWRSNSIKYIVWFGDAPGHNPAGNPTQNYYSQSQAILALQSKGIKVIALDNSALNFYGQASAIASATSGAYYPSVSAATISSTIVSSVVNSNITLYPMVTCPANSPLQIQITPPWAIATPQSPACFSVRVKICDEESCFSGRFQCTIRWYDASTNQQVGANYTVTGTVLPSTTDHIPPVFIPASVAPLLYIQCPDKYKPPKVSAIDNCGPATVTAISGITTSGTCSANTTQTISWTATDGAGNTATMSQTVVNLDTLPPVVSPNCINQTFCVAPTTDSARYCIPYSSFAGCFKDACYGDKLKFNVECANCTKLSEPSSTGVVGFQETCQSPVSLVNAAGAISQGICFDIKGWPKERSCCTFKISATDPCGNTAVAYERLCVLPRGVSTPANCRELKPWTSSVSADPTTRRMLLEQ